MSLIATELTPAEAFSRANHHHVRPPVARKSFPAITETNTTTLQRSPHCACGGGCSRCASEAHANLKVSSPGDQFEREADHVAAHVMRAPETPASTDGESLAKGAVASEAGAGRSSSGAPLPLATRFYFEQRFNQDFSNVRIHTDAQAATSARSLNARAYTIGNDITFAPGQFAPTTQEGRHLLAHELMHTIQQRNATQSDDGLTIARQGDTTTGTTPTPPTATTPAAGTTPTAKEPEKKPADTDVHFGSPKVAWTIFDQLVLKLPMRWQIAYDFAKKNKEDNILFDPQLGRDLGYRQLMAFVNIFYAGTFTGMSKYKPTFSQGLDMAESLSGVSDSYLNLIAMALHMDLKKYLDKDLSDHAMANLGWMIIYGLAIQGALVGINAKGKEDLNFTSLLGKAVKKYTTAPRGFARPHQLGNVPDPRWGAYSFGASPSDFSLKLSGWADPTKPTTLSMNLGFNIVEAAKLYPEKEEDKAKYTGFEAYPYFSFSRVLKDPTGQAVPDPTVPVVASPARSTWLAGVFIGPEAVYTLVEGGQKLGMDSKVMETYFRTGLFARDLGPFTMIQATGETSKRPYDPQNFRGRLNAATTIQLVDNNTWQAIVGGNVGYLFPTQGAPGGWDYGGQVSLYHKYQRTGGLEPLKTGPDLSMTHRQQDPFSMGSPDLWTFKGTLSLFDFVRFSVQYQQVTGDSINTMLPTSDFTFMISPGPGLFTWPKK